jgi:pimeloyl-ACP methyl ester carboxylesterase
MGTGIAFQRRPGRSPTIVFESGLGDGLEVWADVIDQLGSDAAYFAYSRPGYGDSENLEPPAAARNSEQASTLLRVLLHAARVRPPYVLVGHSLGGLYIAHFTATYPEQVAGLVFVDGRPPTFRAACDARGIRFCSPLGSAPPPPDWPAHIVAEVQGIKASEDSAPAMSSVAGIPATVITSTNPWLGEQGAEGFALWLETQEEFARGFTSHRFIRAEGATHYVQREQPALVAREIEALVARIR